MLQDPKLIFQAYYEVQSAKEEPIFPVNVETICDIMGVLYKENHDTKTVLGRFAVTPDNLELRIRRSLDDRHKRFLTVHMIGHLLFHLDFIMNNKFYTESIYPRAEEPYHSMEEQADKFAREVLIPEQFIEDIATSFTEEHSDIGKKDPYKLYQMLLKELSIQFGVDENVVARRAVEVGLVEFL